MSESHWCQCANCTAERIRTGKRIAELERECKNATKYMVELSASLTEAKAELMLAETSVADKCIQIDELQDSYTALAEAARAVVDCGELNGGGCGPFYVVNVGKFEALAALIDTKVESDDD